MSRTPRISGPELLQALRRTGFREVRVRGSHHFLVHVDDPTRWATVPVHMKRVLPLGTLQSVLRTARVSTEELDTLL